MKKHYTIALSLIITAMFAVLGIQSGKAQTSFYDQNFDGQSTLPPGWLSSASGDNGAPWYVDTTGNDSSYVWNGSSGYDNASGRNNCEIPNPTTGTIGAFAYSSELTLTLSTTNWINIYVGWGARVTKHWGDDSSNVQFFMSTDGGATWDNISYFENPGNSDWYWDNNPGGSEVSTPNIQLPSSANHQKTLMFKWLANLYYTASGTYRIDDFNIAGTSSPSAVNDITDKPNALVYVIGGSTINVVAKDIQGPMTVELFDMVGNNLKAETTTNQTVGINASGLASGIYLVRVSDSASSQVTKVSITNR